MNRNKPEKLARIELRVKPKDKERIVKTANQCGLSTSEYVLQRALGYTPKTVNLSEINCTAHFEMIAELSFRDDLELSF